MFQIEKQSRIATKGQTCQKFDATGIGQDYIIRLNQCPITALLRYNTWSNGERDITCLDVSGDLRLNKIIGRMRLCIENLDSSYDYATLKTALIKQEDPAFATLHKRNFTFYIDVLDMDLVAELRKFGDCKINSKEILFNSIAKNRSELCIVYASKNETLPVAAYILTRIIPILYADRPKVISNNLSTSWHK